MALILVMAATPAARADDDVVYPAGSGAVDVRDPRYGARGDGVADDTAALQHALADGLYHHAVVYLPAGTYRVTDTLRWNNGDPHSRIGGWGPFVQLQGQGRPRTVIKLDDRAAGFADPTHPRAVIQTGSGGSDGNKPYHDGEGNEAFENHVRDLTVDVGTGNPAAVGIDYQASNCGAVRHVTVRAGPGSGACGVGLLRRDDGPGMLSDVSVDGFRVGLRLGQEIEQFTLEDVRLTGQAECGVRCHDAVLAARHLTVERGRGPAVVADGVALVVLVDARLAGTVTVGGAAHVVARHTTVGDGSAAVTAGLGLDLPVAETPDPRPGRWTLAAAPTGRDDAAAVQAAVDAGADGVYLRAGTYRLGRPVRVPPAVRRVEGVGAVVDAVAGPAFVVAGGAASDVTVFDRFSATVHGTAGPLVDHTGGRTVVLRDLATFGGAVYRAADAAGPLFVDDVAGSGYRIGRGQHVWGRQWNCEGTPRPKIDNAAGGTVWCLGFKTEGGDTIAANGPGGRTELLGGLAYTFGVDPAMAAFDNRGALAVSFAGTTYAGPRGFYRVLVRSPRGEQTRDRVAARGGGVCVPLLLDPP